jgi:hypothetical protein
MFSPINLREAQVQPMEKHSDPVLLSGVKLYQILSNASAVKYCQALSIFFIVAHVSKDCHMWKHHVLSPSHDDTGYNALARPEHLSNWSQMLAKKYMCLPKCQEISRETKSKKEQN